MTELLGPWLAMSRLVSSRPEGIKVNHTHGADLIISSPCIIGEGAVIERLRRKNDLELDPFLVNSAFIYEEAKRAALETICRQYLDIGCEFGLPLLMST